MLQPAALYHVAAAGPLQVNALHAMLEDADARVRCVAVHATSRVFFQFFECCPLEVTRDFLEKMCVPHLSGPPPPHALTICRSPCGAAPPVVVTGECNVASCGWQHRRWRACRRWVDRRACVVLLSLVRAGGAFADWRSLFVCLCV
jgi:hypothetical protein